ncbi:MAG: cell division protein ZapA [Candidatus Pelagibacter sp. TMED64]|nr:cell division protein ZapA [Candidatus Pelagibacter sp.]OUU65806.1 MAG: cell division protein ZapA [Candidatus Pelagibacter sp. TMED64]|tara:strand:+ start:9147 stop:9593 length:447 start_codon:yes stop_codon:yes gene_type:complete
MANVNIKFNGRDYLLSCDDGQEEDLKNLARYLDKRFLELKKGLGSIGESKLMLITTIKIIDEFFELEKKINLNKNDFNKLSLKFKELKSLAINYKDEKELEIENLKKEITQFEKKIETNHNSYENMLDKVTKSIEEFIDNSESSNNIQ